MSAYDNRFAVIFGASYKWPTGTIEEGVTNVSFSFLSSLPAYYGEAGVSRYSSGFRALNDRERDAVLKMLRPADDPLRCLFQEVARFEFTQQFGPPDQVQMAFGAAEIADPAPAEAYRPDSHPIGGDVWLNAFNFHESDVVPIEIGTETYQTLLHEIGHALGLKHPMPEPQEPPDPNEPPGTPPPPPPPTPPPYLSPVEDSYKYTIMSYNDHPTADVIPSGLMLYDIAAIQQLYGRNYYTRGGDTVYSWGNSPFLYSIWDGGGIDTISAEGQAFRAIIDLRQGEFSSIGTRNGTSEARDNVSVAFYARIENATGSTHDDVLIGNVERNLLLGGDGGDWLLGDGSSLADALASPHGSDLSTRLNSADPNDPKTIGAGYYEHDPWGNESGDDTLFGDTGDDRAFGGAGADSIFGGEGDDYLDGLRDDDGIYGGSGNDSLLGGYGRDELDGEEGNDFIDGEAGNDLVVDRSGNNTLIGGLGEDTIYGGIGDDSIFGVPRRLKWI